MEHLLFLINPISGGSSKEKVLKLIEKHLDHHQFSYEKIFTEYVGHACDILEERKEKEETVVAVGGDGTINEVAKVLAGTQKTMAIIPQGSGNGLARHLGISMNLSTAIQQLNHSHKTQIDTVDLNGHFFLSIAGIGFDSLIAQKFVSSKSRGFWGYASLVIKEYFKYKEQEYQLEIDGKKIQRKAAMIIFANSNQFGYNTVIAPHADLSDGLLEVCIVRKPNLFQIPSILLKLWLKKADQSALLETISAKSISLYPNRLQFANIDGESIEVGEQIEVKIHRSNLNLKIPNHVKKEKI